MPSIPGRLRWLLIVLALLATSAFAAACGDDDDDDDDAAAPIQGEATEPSGDAASEKPTVGFLYVGAVDDGGYNQAAYQGEEALKELGYETISAENVPESAEAERVMEQMIEQGATIIFPTSFGHLDPAINVAERHPDVTFLHQGGLRTTDNVGTYFGTIWQAEYLAGIAAGRMTESDKLGFIVAFPIPQTLLNINAFHLGARSVNPDVTTTVVFTGNWCDPAKNTEATNSLVNQGIDVVTQHQDCPVPVIQAAEGAGIMSIGYHVDDAQFAPEGWITAAIWDWTGLFPELVEQVIDGSYEPSQLRLGLADGVVKLAQFGPNVPQEVQDEVMAAQGQMLSGELFAFTGPISDQDGEVRIAEGERPDVTQLEQIDWLAEGVVGSIPD
ncbi:MAG TPA: BMP family ABC transporter substrate-binding protein [Dehalococcoidia bacterium]|nr:BMP family ABC transporter substrate-binding protein [Dehalococcoidia bacterium]